ncbi:hypothetical protein GURASL_13360 [Geotalea uraniireducens]|uniref:Uncharacterized protein n=1 Tax=Geotalea uraniireducens TaxID=351604 RepID=A0ABN6VQ15_9BACT|nr:hypothetical protein [Geotalea uraniireducens]BDV42413.1 hypothetical protein GURASL_13360 [Geotalea uraniireducens]
MNKVLELIREFDTITTVGELRSALAECPDGVPVGDVVGCPLLVAILLDPATGDLQAEIR